MDGPTTIEGPEVALDGDLEEFVLTGTMTQWQAISLQSLRNTELITDKLAEGGELASKPVPLKLTKRKRRTSL